jgi:hypothetical protein
MEREDEFVDVLLSDANVLGSVYGNIDQDLIASNEE